MIFPAISKKEPLEMLSAMAGLLISAPDDTP